MLNMMTGIEVVTALTLEKYGSFRLIEIETVISVTKRKYGSAVSSRVWSERSGATEGELT
jgi:hypothetical protein